MSVAEELRQSFKKFNKVVLWGFKYRWHTHRFIFQAYYRTLQKCGIPVVWVEDSRKNQTVVETNDLLFTASGMHGRMVAEKKELQDYNFPFRNDIYYCLHAEPDYIVEKIPKDQRLVLKFYTDEAERYDKLYEAVHFDPVTKTLYQPWGTNLLPEEFKEPVFPRSKFVFWVGSIWNDKNNHGNIWEIAAFKTALRERNLKFVHVRFVPNILNTAFIRLSRLAPAIGGRRQVNVNYLPDRMFKNISYGQFGFSNIRKFMDIFPNCSIYDEDMGIMIDRALSLGKNAYIDMVQKQQQICRRYTMAEHLRNIFNKI